MNENTKKLIRKYLPLVAIPIIIFCIINLLKFNLAHFKWEVLFNFAGIAFAGIALIPSWKQAQIAQKQADESSLEALIKRLDESVVRFDDRLNALDKRCDDSDIRYGQYLSELRQSQIAVETESKVKHASYLALIDELFSIRKELAEHRAQLTLATGLADLRMQVDGLRSQVRQLRKPIT